MTTSTGRKSAQIDHRVFSIAVCQCAVDLMELVNTKKPKRMLMPEVMDQLQRGVNKTINDTELVPVRREWLMALLSTAQAVHEREDA
jgi:hypothetical protein